MDPDADDPDMMPTQNTRTLHTAHAPMMGELDLLRAMLEQALDDVQHRCRCTYKASCNHRKIKRNTRYWMKSGAIRWGSFLYLCSVLGLDPEAVRKQARRR